MTIQKTGNGFTKRLTMDDFLLDVFEIEVIREDGVTVIFEHYSNESDAIERFNELNSHNFHTLI